RGCGDWDVYVSGVDDPAVRESFLAEAIDNGFQISFEPPTGPRSSEGTLTAVFGSFATLDEAQAQLTAAASAGFRIATLQLAGPPGRVARGRAARPSRGERGVRRRGPRRRVPDRARARVDPCGAALRSDGRLDRP